MSAPSDQTPASSPSQLSPGDERLWATLTHLIAGGVNILSGLGAGFIAAIITYFVFRDRGPFVRQHVTTTLNFQLTLIIATIVGYITTFILIGFLILALVAIANIIFTIIAIIKANRGEYYQYPFTIKFVH